MGSKQEWLVILPDKVGVLEDRMKVRADHMKNLKPNISAGHIVMGGATLDEPIKDGTGLKINGSALVAVAETKEEVMETVKSDIYYKSGVWDPEKIQVIPFKSAVRKELDA